MTSQWPAAPCQSAAPCQKDAGSELMLRFKDGDAGSFALLVERYRMPLLRYFYRWVRNYSVAEELTQEVFLRVHRSRGAYEPTAKFTSWLYLIAKRLAINSVRDHQHEWREERLDNKPWNMPVRQLRDARPSTEQFLLYQVKLDEVRNAVAELPEKQRSAVLMHKYEELQYWQIAIVLSCSESAVKSLLFRAHETLRARLAHMAPVG